MKISSVYNKLIESDLRRGILLEELSLLIEREIEVGASLEKKLNNVNKPYADKLLRFLKSNQISDNTSIYAIDYKENDNKTLTAFYKEDGKDKSRNYKVGKLLVSLGINLSEFKGYEIEDLISHLKKGTTEDFRLVDGEEILWAYHCENYDEGETMGSCMRYAEAQKFFGIYTTNPDSVKCLVLINPKNNKVRGRALIWHTDADEFFMDTIYLTNNEYRNLFNQYAEEHGYKTYTNSTVTLDNVEFEHYPYMDTFKYLNMDDKTLMTEYDDEESTVKLEDTQGNTQEAGEVVTLGSREGETFSVDVVQWLSYQTPTGNVEGYAHEDDCTYLDGSVYLDEDVVEVRDADGNRELIFKYDVEKPYVELTYGSYEGEYALYDDVVKLNIEEYGDDVYALNDDEVVELSEEKYGDEDNYALTKDAKQLFTVKYGDDKYALADDVELIKVKDSYHIRGLVAILKEDLANLGDLGEYSVVSYDDLNQFIKNNNLNTVDEVKGFLPKLKEIRDNVRNNREFEYYEGLIDQINKLDDYDIKQLNKLGSTINESLTNSVLIKRLLRNYTDIYK
jgi:hypothetical protein